MFSFIIPVLYEGSSINNIIGKLYNQFSTDVFEIIVVDGDPKKSTIRHISFFNHSKKQSNIKPLPPKYPTKIKLLVSQPGRGTQMNAGARLAEGDILIFLHADTQMPSDGLKHIIEIMNTSQYKAGAFKLAFDSERSVYRLIEKLASWRCCITRIPYGDQAIFMSKFYFQKIGGFAEIPIMEDIDLMLRIRKRKDRVYISDKCIKTSARRWEDEGVLYCAVRSSILALLFKFGIQPYRLLKYYKIFRSNN